MVELRRAIFVQLSEVPANATVEHMGMRSAASIARYKLVPESSQNGAAPPDGSAPPSIKRYRLARVGVARRSALGVDRHERMEQIATQESRR